MITINEEAKQDSLSPLSLSNMSEIYKTSNDIFTFPSPELTTIEKNLYFLLRNSTQEDFKQKYKYRPDYLSYDQYGTTMLAFLLMFVNSVSCIEDFNLDTVIIPGISSIIDMCRDIKPKKTVAKMTAIDW